MSAALRCDWCESVVVEDDDAHAMWLRVERNGKGLGPVGPLPSVVLNSAYIFADDSDSPAGEVSEEVEGIDEPAPLRHFCGWQCLSRYAEQAAALG